MTVRLAALLVCWLLGLGGAAQAMADASPQALIAQATERLVQALRQDGEAIKQEPALAYRISDAIIVPLVDFRGVARWVMGKHWRDATPAQRERFLAEFQAFLIRTYVTAMVSYSQDIVSHARNIRYLPVHATPGEDKVMVPTVIRLESGPSIRIDYRMHRVRGSWKIYDVTVGGVSLAAANRDAFVAEIERYGIDGVTERLAARNHRQP